MCNGGFKFNKLRLKGHMFNMGSVPLMLVKMYATFANCQHKWLHTYEIIIISRNMEILSSFTNFMLFWKLISFFLQNTKVPNRLKNRHREMCGALK